MNVLSHDMYDSLRFHSDRSHSSLELARTPQRISISIWWPATPSNLTLRTIPFVVLSVLARTVFSSHLFLFSTHSFILYKTTDKPLHSLLLFARDPNLIFLYRRVLFLTQSCRERAGQDLLILLSYTPHLLTQRHTTHHL